MTHFTVHKNFLRKIVVASLAFASIFTGCFGTMAPAKASGSYEAMIVSLSGSGTLSMLPGEKKEVTVVFQNTGSATWKNDGAGYLSLYTYNPKYRKSVFDPGTWLWGDHVKRIREASVAPGGTASISFELKAPLAKGVYEESFQLAAEDTAWVSGGAVAFKISVQDVGTSASTTTSTTASATTTNSSDGYEASLSVRSADSIKAIAGRSILFTVGFTNTGTKTWNSYSLTTGDVSMASSSSFRHPSWVDSQLAVASSSVKPGEMAILSFSLTAPSTNGRHTAKFQFSADGVDVDDAFIEIPVDVTGGSAEAVASPENENAIDTTDYIEEPLLRVGVLIVDEETDNEVVITCEENDFNLRDINGNLLAELEAGDEVTASYDGERYLYDVGRGTEYSSYGLRFEPETENAVMKIANFDRRVTRSAAYADNEYRNILELRYNDYKDRTWIINEIDIEWYLRGLAETSNSSPLEYQKALISAARTFAYYHWTHATKRAKEFMTIVGYSDDQVYNGYGQEKRSPNIVAGVEATRGKVVTYAGDIAITPYFSRSDGHTRNWSDVWYGSLAWCQSVDVPWDDGKTLWGHGVGMSASGALGAAKDGYNWEEILKYFYTGIDLEKRWE
ncbi:MAG: SpoIID/LytB domain-containing protein [Patescibacteria group bacterium]|jgi:hypothetical protein